MATLKVNLAHLRKTAQQMSATATQYRRQVKASRETVNLLCDAEVWSGEKSDEFYDEFQDNQEAIDNWALFLEAASEKVNEAADRYEKLRQALQSIIGGALN